MYPDLAEVINTIQRSSLKSDNALVAMVCKAVQEYYKQLNSISALKGAKKG